jgi:peroxiredoxin
VDTNFRGKSDYNKYFMKVGDKALDFTLFSYSGQGYSLYGTHGYVMLVFYKVTCPTCQLTLPFVEKMYKLYGDKITFYGIVQDGPKDAEDFARRYSLTFPQLLDYPDYKVSESYLVEVVPTIYLVNEEKLIEFVSSSFVKKDLENLIRKLSLVAQRPEQDIFEGTQVPVFKPG